MTCASRAAGLRSGGRRVRTAPRWQVARPWRADDGRSRCRIPLAPSCPTAASRSPARRAGRSAARPLRSKTSSTSPARSPAAAIRTGWRAMDRLRPTRLRSRRCSMPAPDWSARRSPKSSPSAWSGAIPTTGHRPTSRRRDGWREDLRAVRRPRSAAVWRIWRWAATPVARCACRRAIAGSTACGRPMAGSASTASCRWRRASTRSAGSRATRSCSGPPVGFCSARWRRAGGRAGCSWRRMPLPVSSPASRRRCDPQSDTSRPGWARPSRSP